jgi:hypothetical protein
MKAVIGISSGPDRDALRTLQKIDAGKRLPGADYQLDSPARWNCLRVAACVCHPAELKSAGALSVYALAKRLGRSYSNVHGDIQRLLAPAWWKNAAGQVRCRLTISLNRRLAHGGVR